MKNKNNGKLTFKEKVLQKSFGSLVEKLIIATFYIHKQNLNTDFTYDDYMLLVKDTLNNGVREE